MKQTFLTSIICIFAVINGFAQTFSGGNGSEIAPYLISTKADMETLATAVNAGNPYSGKYFLLTTDVPGVTTVIGGNNNNYVRPFSGIFDGGGHTIRVNINISYPYVYAGVFGYAHNAIIKNLGVTGTVSASSSDSNDAGAAYATTYAGGILGYGSGSSCRIENCYNNSNVISSSSYNNIGINAIHSEAYAGGISGYYGGNEILNCYNSGTVSSSVTDGTVSPAPTTVPLYTDTYTGGISGYLTNPDNTVHAKITNCHNTGNLTSYPALTNGYAYIGGICGYLNGIQATISNSFSANAVITNSGSSNAGRLVGFLSGVGIVANCHALSSMSVNGAIISSTNEAGKDGKDEPLSAFKTATFITGTLGWNTSNIWTMSNAESDNQGFPILANVIPSNPITIIPLTIAGITIADKEYDATTAATVSEWGKLVGVVDGDVVLINSTGVTASFDNKNVGTGKTVTLSGNIQLSGADAGNYILTQPTGLTANITPRSSAGKALTISELSIASKEYDGTTAATISNSGTLTGVLAGDNVTYSITGITASFNDKNAGNNKPVTLNRNITLSGADAGNYALIQPTLAANITTKKITVTADPQSKMYGRAEPSLTYTHTPDLFAGDVFTGSLTRESGEDMGTYNILQGTLSAGNNYTIDFKGALFTIFGSPVTELTELLVNNEPVDISDEDDITYLLTCGVSSVSIDAITAEYGVASVSGDVLPYTFTPTVGENTLSILITSQDGENTKTYTVKIIKPLEGVVVQVWDDVLSVINIPANNGGYEFSTYQWQENGVDMPGETHGNLYLADNPNAATAVYTVSLTEITGQSFQSCPVTLTNSQRIPLRIYPNPVQNNIVVESSNIKAGDRLNIYDVNGHFVRTFNAAGNQTEINLSGLPLGTYILKVNNEQTKLFKK
ncbi:hypothetical protein FACS189415_3080 [Bacteroidia bacterium]|nr:hypothetical protein FACS189426_16550 [Bacteroidia bacterium]GHU82513.1 hypothetical protein FACS189415_3080 [Bacteroidia bacterium]